MTPTEAAKIDPVFSALAERVLELRLALWRCNADGKIVTGPSAHESALPWLRSDLMSRWVGQTARRAWGRKVSSPVELYKDCWLIPIPERHGKRQIGLLLALALGPAALDTEEFGLVCASAHLDPASGREGVAALLSAKPTNPRELSRLLGWMCDDLIELTNEQTANDQFCESLAQSYEETNLLYRLARVMNISADPAQSIAIVSGQIQAIMPFLWIAVGFAKTSSVPGLGGHIIMSGSPPCPQADFEQMVWARLDRQTMDDSTKLLLPGDDRLAGRVGSEVIYEPIAYDGKVVGAILAGNKRGTDPDVSSVEMQFLDAAADFMGVFHENIVRFLEQREMFTGTVKSLTSAIDAKDKYTCGHSERVALLASQLARALQLDEAEIEVVHIAGLVHDVGKIGVPEAVLTKPGRLSDQEFEQIKQHPVIGYNILKDIPPLARMLPGVRHHHERWDGNGYPDRLAGEQIPLIGAILACADAFDAMSSNRSYRKALEHDQVMDAMRSGIGVQFSPVLVPLFLELDFSEYQDLLSRHVSQDRRAVA